MTRKRTAVSWNPRRHPPSPQQNKTVSSAPSTSVRLPQPEQEDDHYGGCRGTHANACLCIPVKIRAWLLHLAVWDPDRRCPLVGRHGEGASLNRHNKVAALLSCERLHHNALADTQTRHCPDQSILNNVNTGIRIAKAAPADMPTMRAISFPLFIAGCTSLTSL